MDHSPLEALAYVKAEVPDDDPAPVLSLTAEESPVLKRIGGGLLVAYLLDEGDRFSYVQNRHLRAAGVDADQLHTHALANLGKLAKGKVTIRQNGPTWALFFDGNLEASLILLDEMWDSALRSYHSGEPVIALPARDVLCFCDASSPAGVAELRALVSRLWPEGDHLISDRLFRRRGGRWVPYDDVS